MKKNTLIYEKGNTVDVEVCLGWKEVPCMDPERIIEAG